MYLKAAALLFTLGFKAVWDLLVTLGSLADGDRRVPAAILLAQDLSAALQAVTFVTLKCHRLPRCRDKSSNINLPPVLYIWVYADGHWK